MSDLISRADAVDAISKIKRTDNWQAAVSMALMDLPSALPEILACGEGELISNPDVPDTNVGDMISRQWLMECVNEGWIKFDTEKDANTYIHLVRDIAPSAQPETNCSEFPNNSDTISRQAAIATAISGRVRTLPTTEDGENWIRVNEVRDSLLSLPSAQPEHTMQCNFCSMSICTLEGKPCSRKVGETHEA